MVDIKTFIDEQEKENIAIREQAEKEAFILAKKEKAETWARINAEIKQAYAAKEFENEALRRDAMEKELERRLRQEALQAGKEENYYINDFVDDAVDYGRSVIDALKDYYKEIKEKMMEKLEDASLAIDSEYTTEQEFALTKFVSGLKEGTWRRELAENLIKNGDVKTERQLKMTLEKYSNVVEATSAKQFDAFLEKDTKWYGRGIWERDYISDLVAKGEIQTMDEALDNMIAYDKWRNRNPDLSAVMENCQIYMNQLGEKNANEKDAAVLIEFQEQKVKDLEKSIAYLLEKGDIPTMSQDIDNIIADKKWREQNPDRAFLKDFIENTQARIQQLHKETEVVAHELRRKQNPERVFLEDGIKSTQARIHRFDEQIETTVDEKEKIQLRELRNKDAELLNYYDKHSAILNKIEADFEQKRLDCGMACNDKEQAAIKLRLQNKILRGVKNKEGLEVEIHWKEKTILKDEQYRVVDDIEFKRGEKTICHCQPARTIDETITEAIKTWDASYDKGLDFEPELSR